jgi:DNA-binding MarR family transcriptional regulator
VEAKVAFLQSVSDEDKQVLKGAMHLMDEFAKLRPTMPLQQARAFLLVASNEGLGVQEYAQLANVSQSVMTRNLLDLGARNRKREPGFGLLVSRMDPMDMRKHQTPLTDQGQRLVKRVVDTLRCG